MSRIAFYILTIRVFSSLIPIFLPYLFRLYSFHFFSFLISFPFLLYLSCIISVQFSYSLIWKLTRDKHHFLMPLRMRVKKRRYWIPLIYWRELHIEKCYIPRGGKFTSIVLVSLLQDPYRPRRLAGGEQLATSAALEVVSLRVWTDLPYLSAHGKIFKRSLAVTRLEASGDKDSS